MGVAVITGNRFVMAANGDESAVCEPLSGATTVEPTTAMPGEIIFYDNFFLYFFLSEVYADSIPIINKAKKYKSAKSYEDCNSLCIDTECATWYFKVRKMNEFRKIII